MAEAKAWLLPLDEQLMAAIGEYELTRFITDAQLYPVPGAPAHCKQVCVWQNQLLPVVDLLVWLHGTAPAADTRPIIAITAYHAPSDTLPHYGALALSAAPQQVLVDDDQACALPATPARWRRIAVSCFSQQHRPVPIIDLGTVFSDALLD